MSAQFLECRLWNFSQNKILDKYFPENSSYSLQLVGRGPKCARAEVLNSATVEGNKNGKKGLHLNPSANGHLDLRFRVHNVCVHSRINRDGTAAANLNLGTHEIHGHKLNFVASLATTTHLNPLLFRLTTRFPRKKCQSSVSIRRGERNGYHLGFRNYSKRGPLSFGLDTSLNVHNIRFSQFNFLLAYKLRDVLINLNHASHHSHEGGLALGNVELNLTSRRLSNKVVSLNLKRNFETKEAVATVGGRVKVRDNALVLAKVDSHLNTVLGGHIDFKNGLLLTLAAHFNPLLGAKNVDFSHSLPFGVSLKYKI